MVSSTTTTTVLKHSVPSGDTAAEITFFKDPADGSIPFNYVYKPPEGQPQSNIGSEIVKVEIQDIRGKESTFSVDSSGFVALSNIPSKMVYKDWENDEIIKKNYYPEVEKLLLDNLTGANRVLIFDHTIRRTTPLDNTPPEDIREPVKRAHIDQNERASHSRVRLHLPGEADELLKGMKEDDSFLLQSVFRLF